MLYLLVLAASLRLSSAQVDASGLSLFSGETPPSIAQASFQHLSFLTRARNHTTAQLAGSLLQKKDTPAAPEVRPVQTQTTVTTVMTFWNGVMLATTCSIFLKVRRSATEGIDLLTSAEASEDASISKALPSVLVWVALGIILVCFNKYLFLAKEQGGFGFPFPMSLTWWHMFTGFLCTNIVRATKPELMPAVQEGKLGLHGFLTAIVPIGLVLGGYLAIGNSAYLYLSVSFVQMLKSSGPMFVYAISVACGLERLSAAAVMAICIVVMGVAGASVGETAFSWFGFALQFTAFVLDGIRMVLFKMLMSSRGTKLDPLSGLYYYSPVCVVFLFLPMIHYEGHNLLATLSQASPWLLGVLAINGMVAFSLNLSMLSLFANASATTISMASVVRDIMLTFGTALLFHTTITKVQILGYLSACVGVTRGCAAFLDNEVHRIISD
jgi:hypothetical protein